MAGASSSRILIVRMSSLGDLFHALPAVHLIRTSTGAMIDWVVNEGYAELVSCFEGVDRVIPFPRHRLTAGLGGFISELRRESYDRILDFQGLLKSALVARAARGSSRIGPSYQREGARYFYNELAGIRDKERHAVDENLDMVRHLGLDADDVTFPLRFPEPEALKPSPRIALLPCSRWPTKNWPPDRFAEAANRLVRSVGASIYLFGASEDKDVCTLIETAVEGDVINLCGATSLPALGGYLKGMDLVITVDSGPMHMAAATGTPVIAVFGATDAKRTGPYGDHKVINRADLSCRPCFSRTCRLPSRDIRCLTGLDVNPVVQAAETILAGS